MKVRQLKKTTYNRKIRFRIGVEMFSKRVLSLMYSAIEEYRNRDFFEFDYSGLIGYSDPNKLDQKFPIPDMSVSPSSPLVSDLVVVSRTRNKEPSPIDRYTAAALLSNH